MTDLRARIEAARKAGYSDADIQARLNDVPEIKRAREAGYSDADIYGRLGLSVEPQVTGEVGFMESIRQSPAVKKLAAVAERLAPSPEEVVAGVGEAVENLPESAVGMGARGYALAELAASPLVEGDFSRYGQAARAVGESLAALPGQAYEAITSPVETIESAARFARKDPLAAMAAVSGVTGGVGAFMRPGNVLSKISRVTNPLATPGALAQGAYRVGQEFLSPVFTQAGAERAAANQLLGSVMGRPADVTAALRTESPSLLGNVPAAERLAAAGQYEPIIATLQRDLTTGLTEGGREALVAQQQRLAGIQQQIAAIDADLQAQGRAMSPEARAQLSAVRSDLMRARAEELRNLEAAQAQVSQQIPATGQLAPGEAINARARVIRDSFRKARIEPLYEAAFGTAGNRHIDTRSVIQTAENILGGRLADVPLGVATRTVRDLTRLERGATLRELDHVRKSVNKDIAAAQAAGKPMGDLYDLHAAIDTAVRDSRAIPERAKFQYAEALNVYRSEFVPRFRTGAAVDVLRTTKKNQSGILPSATVSKFLANEDNAAQFAAMFGDDAIAKQALTSGVQDLLRKRVVDPTTRAVDAREIDKFVAENARQLEIVGLDAEQTFGPVRAEAARLQQGYADLSKELAFAEDVRTPGDLVSKLLADPAAMDATRRRLTEAGREALTKEVVDRAIRLLSNAKPEEAVKYLEDNVVRMVVEQPYIDRLKNLAENQKALQEIEKRAPTADLSKFKADLSKVPRDRLLDMKLLAAEIDRMEDAERMMGLRPTEKVSVIGAEQQERLKRGVSGFMSRKASVMEKVADVLGSYANRKTSAVLTDVLTKNPARAAELIERALAAQSKAPRTPETARQTLTRAGVTGSLAGANALAPENRNAMANR